MHFGWLTHSIFRLKENGRTSSSGKRTEYQIILDVTS